MNDHTVEPWNDSMVIEALIVEADHSLYMLRAYIRSYIKTGFIPKHEAVKYANEALAKCQDIAKQVEHI